MNRPIHPQSVTGEPQALRWVTDTGDVPVGEVVQAPGTLGPLLDYGVLTRVLVERGGVWTWLADGKDWTEHGPRIRDAIIAALNPRTSPARLPNNPDTDTWEVVDSPDLLQWVARDVVEVELATYIRSHGGAVTVDDVTDGVVTVGFSGACEDCPAQGSTLHDRIEKAIQARYPALQEVRRPEPQHSPRAFLGIPLPGRGRR